MKPIRQTIAACAIVASLAASVAARADGASPYGSLHWRAIGPANSGGRATSVAGTDDDPFLYYVGTAGGGVFKTVDGGIHWSSVWDKEPVGAIGAVAIAPRRKDVVWVGTGEANPRNDVSYGDGVYLSTDGGDTWSHRGLDGTRSISRILVAPTDPNIALVGALGDPFADSADRGVYRTTDGGKTWMKTLTVGPSSGASDLAWNPRTPDIVFAGVWQFRRTGWGATSGGPDDGLYRSADGGKTWTKLGGHGLPDGEMGRIGVAVAPSDPQRVYAIIESRRGLLWASDDAGLTWRFVSKDTTLDQRPFYYSHLYVDPTDENHLLSVSVDLAESRDGGKTWTTNKGAVHGDHHDIWWSADGKRIANANDGGTALSADGGAHWEWRNNYAAGQSYRVGYDFAIPYDVCEGQQDNSAWCGPSTAASGSIDPRDWLNVTGGDATWVWPDPADADYVWVASGGGNNGGELALYDKRSAQAADISPYEGDTNGIGVSAMKYRLNWESPLAFSPQDPRIAYFGGDVIFKTTDRGAHWTPISPDLTRDDKAHQQVSGGDITHDATGAEAYDTTLSIAPSPRDGREIWVGTDDGLVRLTRDGGAHWADVTMRGIGPYGRVAMIAASAYAAGRAYATVDRHYQGDMAPYVFATDDYGKSWRALTSGLPSDQFVRTIVEDPVNPRLLFAGLEQGVWMSRDGGTRWEPFQLDMPAASVRDLRIHPRERDLIAATHGRSIFILDDLTPLEQLDRAQAAGTYLFQPRTAYELLTTPSGEENGGPSAFSGDAADDGALISYYCRTAEPGAWLDILDAHGRRVRHLAGTHEVDGKQTPYVPADAGIDLLNWDLADDPPASWLAAPAWNRDAIGATPVAPGRYTAVLHAGGRSYSASFSVKEDPRATWTFAQESLWRAMMTRIASRMDAIDTQLNALDRLDKTLDARRSDASGHAALLDAIAGVRAHADAVRAALTSDPQSDQDDDFLPDMPREQLQALWEAMAGARVTPTPAQTSQFASIDADARRADAAFHRIMADVDELDAQLRAAGIAPIASHR